ncbi:MAG: helix-turn-helix domain-containing protein [Bacteroidales bacterium]
MKDRLTAILEDKKLSSSEFASSLDIQRSNVSHILTGRNKPSFSFIERLLSVYPDINARWLIMGEGDMHNIINQDIKRENIDEGDIFAHNYVQSNVEFPRNEVEDLAPFLKTPNQKSTYIDNKENSTTNATRKRDTERKDDTSQDEITKVINNAATTKEHLREVEKIAIFYTDGSFRMYQNS